MATTKNDASKTTSTDAGADAGTGTGAGAWASIDGHLEQMKRTGDRLGEVSEEMMSKGFSAFESLTQLTRDNLASGRQMAKQWSELGAESVRRQVELMTPSWLR